MSPKSAVVLQQKINLWSMTTVCEYCDTTTGQYKNGTSFVWINSMVNTSASTCFAGTQCYAGCCTTCMPGIACPTATVAITPSFSDNVCPAGYRCDTPDLYPEACEAGLYCLSGGKVFNCTDAVDAVRDNVTGQSVYDGAYCPNASSSLGICSGGNYCPTTRQQILCPEGHYCPPGSLAPIACRSVVNCPAGTSENQPFLWGSLIVLIILIALWIPLFGYRMVKRRFTKHSLPQNEQLVQAREEIEARESDRALARRRRSIASGLPGFDDLAYGDSGANWPQALDTTPRPSQLPGGTVGASSTQTSGPHDGSLRRLPTLSPASLSPQSDNMSLKEGYEPFAIEVDEVEAGGSVADPVQMASTSADSRKAATKSTEAPTDKTKVTERTGTGITLTVPPLQSDSRRTSSAASAESAGDSEGEAVTYHGPGFSELQVAYKREAAYQSGIELGFRNLSLEVAAGGKRTLVLNNVSGVAPAAKLTAVMGTSGSGKTSLVNALCGRAYYGRMTGEVLANGVPMNVRDHRGAVCFVPQDDIVHSDLTVLENFVFGGLFMLPRGTSLEDVKSIADFTVMQLELENVKHSVVGDVDKRGVSGGQRKRVNIGLELMRRPKILILDEPTSGLDSAASLMVSEALARLLKTGVTVMSIIHQPRYSIFAMFHHIILLGFGGRVMYCGKPTGVVPYFKKLRYVFPRGENPADVMLDISSGAVGPTDHTVLTQLASSRELEYFHAQSGETLPTNDDEEVIVRNIRAEALCDAWDLEGADTSLRPMTADKDAEVPLHRHVHPTRFRQFVVFLVRGLLQRWRAKHLILLETFCLVGAAYLAILVDGVNDSMTSINMQYQFCMLMCLQFAVLMTLSAMRSFAENKLIFYRETSSGVSINSFFYAQNLLDLLEHGLQAAWVSAIHVDMRTTRVTFWNIFLLYQLSMWFCTGWGYIFSLIFPRKNAYVYAGIIVTISNTLLSGTFAVLDYKTIYQSTGIYLLVGFVSSARWYVEWLIVSEGRTWGRQYMYRLRETDAGVDGSYSLLMNYLGYKDEANVVVQSASGWYWCAPWLCLVGLMLRVAALFLLHELHRGQSGRRSRFHSLRVHMLSPRWINRVRQAIDMRLYQWVKKSESRTRPLSARGSRSSARAQCSPESPSQRFLRRQELDLDDSLLPQGSTILTRRETVHMLSPLGPNEDPDVTLM